MGTDGVTFEWLASWEVVTQAGGHLDVGTLDAKLGSALTKVSPSSFLETLQARERAAMGEGRRFQGESRTSSINASKSLKPMGQSMTLRTCSA